MGGHPFDQTRTEQFMVPLLAFQCRTPPDGLPCLEDWESHALSILGTGYEGWREAVEIRAVDRNTMGHPMAYGSVEASKGKGRVSILLYAVCQTYLIKNQLSQDEVDLFTKSFGSNQINCSIMSHNYQAVQELKSTSQFTRGLAMLP